MNDLAQDVFFLPSDYKYHKGQKKYILREIVHKYIPKSQMDRPKMGFAIPIEDWLYRELKPLVLQYLAPTHIMQQQLFDPSQVETLLREFYAGRKEKHLQIWHLLMFQMWHERWMNS
jgi:asparagine synthase (glutamine-hydrolysing)